LIITCEECSTRFELDESRIPVTGARVRCSCCKHAFFLPNPTASASEAADSIAAAAAADDAVGLPTPASDLTSEVASGAASSSPEAEIEEEDWEFSEVIRSEDDDDFDAEEDPGAEDDFDPEPDFDRSFDASNLSEDHGEDDLDVVGTADEQPGVGALDEADNSGLQLEAESEGLEASTETGIEAGHDESSFGSVDDFSSLMEDDDLDSCDVSVEAESSPLPVSGDEADVGLYSVKGSAEELEDPGSWDLALGADFASSKTSGTTAIGSISSGGAVTGTAGLEADRDPAAYEEEPGKGLMLRGVLLRLGSLAGWIFTIGAVVFVGFLNLEAEWTRLQPTTQFLRVGSVLAKTTDWGWVETTRSGSLLIVNGLARNSGGKAIWPPHFQVAILDHEGERIMTAEVAVGEPLAESVLREASPTQLERAAALARRGFVATPMGSGEVRAFQAVIGQLPEAAGRILLGVAQAGGLDPTLLPDSNSPIEPGAEAAEGNSAAKVAENLAPAIEG